MNRYFTEEDIYVAKKKKNHIKRCVTSLGIRKRKLRDHYIPFRTAKINSGNTNASKSTEKSELLYMLVGP